ncbi:TetR-like C-terminal domain-containing protein [Streptomyces griseochromogenes]|uniref:TetR-like C-terminal domain-containing protein n=1 Tax=Streptomyces griseochromogenes TaxID=68214 RepID=UPI00378DDC82
MGTKPPRRGNQNALIAAIDRDELPADLDLEHATDLVFGPFWYRLLVGHAPPRPRPSQQSCRAAAERPARQLPPRQPAPRRCAQSRAHQPRPIRQALWAPASTPACSPRSRRVAPIPRTPDDSDC